MLGFGEGGRGTAFSPSSAGFDSPMEGRTDDCRSMEEVPALYDAESSVSKTNDATDGDGGGGSLCDVAGRTGSGGGPISVRSFVGDDGPRAEGCIEFAGREGSFGEKSSEGDDKTAALWKAALFSGEGILIIFVVLDPYGYTGLGSPGGGAGKGCVFSSSENRTGALMIKSSMRESLIVCTVSRSPLISSSPNITPPKTIARFFESILFFS